MLAKKNLRIRLKKWFLQEKKNNERTWKALGKQKILQRLHRSLFGELSLTIYKRLLNMKLSPVLQIVKY